jgi:hypothetical protein
MAIDEFDTELFDEASILVATFKTPPNTMQHLFDETAISCAIIHCDGLIKATSKPKWYRIKIILNEMLNNKNQHNG